MTFQFRNIAVLEFGGAGVRPMACLGLVRTGISGLPRPQSTSLDAFRNEGLALKHSDETVLIA